MLTSEAKIMAVMDFLVHEMGFEPSLIVKRPVVLGLSLKKRIVPRGTFVLDLLSRGLVKKLNLSSFCITEGSFSTEVCFLP